MAVKILSVKFFHGGIAESEKIGLQGSFYFGQKLNIYEDASKLTILPKTVKISASTCADLPKWIVSGSPHDTNKYAYGNAGHIYEIDSDDAVTDLQTTSNSGGQGACVHGDYLYYATDTDVGRYGLLSGVPTFDDTWGTDEGETFNSTATTNFAPMITFKEGWAMGNGNDLTWWDGTILDQNRIILPPGLQIRCLEILDEYIVMGTWRGSAITDNEEGYLFFWDGISTTYNFFVPILEGGVQALLTNKNRLISVIGSAGNIFLNFRPFQKVQQIPKLVLGKYAEVFPGAMTNWRGMAHFGLAGNTDSAAIHQGVYSYGSKSEIYPEVLNYGYPISTGNSQATNIAIGALKGIGNKMYIGWKDDTSYGLDVVTNSGNPYASAVYEGLIADDEQLFNDKLAKTLKVKHLPLASGESIQIGYKINRAATYTTDTANSTVGSTETRLPLPSPGRFSEFQFEVILATSGTTSPTVTYIGLEYDDLKKESGF